MSMAGNTTSSESKAKLARASNLITPSTPPLKNTGTLIVV